MMEIIEVIGIEKDDADSIKNNEMKIPCFYCDGIIPMIYLGFWNENPEYLFFGCEKCDRLFLLNIDTFLMYTQNYTFSMFRSMRNEKPHPIFKCRFFDGCEKTIMKHYECLGICAGNAIFKGSPQHFPEGTMCPVYEKNLKRLGGNKISAVQKIKEGKEL
ncbi:MAG: hypothetical protein PHH24_03110 [Candidatus Moranbacteria bacterium]|jgi:hypothetical protein|nr:hypothetical protein [Candidatus Moranbacteria bacterium]MDD5651880.1 hypothetical protein [Candidatus Moranbacteria bacterium]MDX9855230.1 hypothetical protein [Candidatus Moranbacteria bacterium]